jgi:thioester reductase-like protein
MDDLAGRLGRLSEAQRKLLRSRLGGAARAVVETAAGALPAAPMSVAEMEAAAVLDPEIEVARARPQGEPRSVLLTGASGFLGAFLLDELLRRTPARVVCLVRATGADDARRRIADNLADHRLPGGGDPRVVPIAGDLAQPALGLGEAAFQELARGVDAVVHCGALVKWTYPYAALVATNVFGTREALRLAAATGAPFHFISTVGVFSSPDRAPEPVAESAELATSGPLHVGYAQSKWVAERLVWHTAARGLPVTVHRPNVGPPSAVAAFNRHDHVWGMVKGCIEMRCAPDFDFAVCAAPVDFVAAAVVRLSRSADARGRAFHLVNPHGMLWSDLCRGLAAYGYALEVTGMGEWRSRLRRAVLGGRAGALLGLSAFFSESLFERARLPPFDCRETLRALTGSGLVCPPLDERLLRTWLDGLVARGFLPPPGG